MTTKTEIATLQTAWRTAATRPDGLTIACPDLATARNLRFRLYNAVKPFRDGKAQPDPALAEALGVLKVSVTTDPPSVSLTRKCVVDLVSAALAEAGVAPEAVADTETLEAGNSLERVLQLTRAAEEAQAEKAEKLSELFPAAPATAEPLPVANPFFTRGNKPGESY